MVHVDKRFPETTEGIKRAQEVAGPDGDWAQYVNWWGNDGGISARAAIAEAMRSDADVSPELLERFGLVAGARTTVATTEIRFCVPYAGTEGPADMPVQAIVPDGPRAHLPA